MKKIIALRIRLASSQAGSLPLPVPGPGEHGGEGDRRARPRRTGRAAGWECGTPPDRRPAACRPRTWRRTPFAHEPEQARGDDREADNAGGAARAGSDVAHDGPNAPSTPAGASGRRPAGPRRILGLEQGGDRLVAVLALERRLQGRLVQPRITASFDARIDIGLQSRSSRPAAGRVHQLRRRGATSLTKPSSMPSCARHPPAGQDHAHGALDADRPRQAMQAAGQGRQAHAGSGRANTAVSEAMIRSQASAISKPPPMATPFTAAISGLLRSKRRGQAREAARRAAHLAAASPATSGRCPRRRRAPRPR